MNIKNKVFHLDSQFTKELPKADETIDSIYISGYASANTVDRSGDVIPTSVWEKGMENYLKNPVILAYHDHDDPVGRMVEHKVDNKGLWIKARISAAAEVFNLVKDGVITAFSVGFKVKDAEYNAELELFVIKELELIEISVVSVPCNQDTLFSLSKSFDSDEDYKLFKLQFVPQNESAKGPESPAVASGNKQKEIGMDPKELQAMLDNTAKSAAELATKALIEKQAAEKAAAEKAAQEAADLEKRIAEAVAKVTPTTTGAEKLLEEVTKRIEEQAESSKKALAGLEESIREKAAELAAIQKSKMTFTEGKADGITYAEKEKAILLSKISGKAITETKFGKELATKALGAGAATGAHLPSQTWEHEVSTQMESEVRRRLVSGALGIRAVTMATNVMSFPVNPEAGYGTWVTNAQFGSANSSGTTENHQLKEVTLNSYKLATKEFMNFEEEEDSLIVLLPIVRDAMVRRTAKSVDKAVFLGAGTGADPVRGLAKYDDVSVVTKQVANTFSTADLRALRKDLGAWGLDPSEIVFVVNTEAYYDLMEDSLFQTMDKVGDRATVLTGQVGMVGGTPVLVSAELPAKTSGANTGGNTANVGALAIAPANFLIGNQRGLRFDTDDIVAEQRKVLVASLRMGMTQITTNIGQGVSAFRWLV